MWGVEDPPLMVLIIFGLDVLTAVQSVLTIRVYRPKGAGFIVGSLFLFALVADVSAKYAHNVIKCKARFAGATPAKGRPVKVAHHVII
jgi:hypothetical protein